MPYITFEIWKSVIYHSRSISLHVGLVLRECRTAYHDQVCMSIAWRDMARKTNFTSQFYKNIVGEGPASLLLELYTQAAHSYRSVHSPVQKLYVHDVLIMERETPSLRSTCPRKVLSALIISWLSRLSRSNPRSHLRHSCFYEMVAKSFANGFSCRRVRSLHHDPQVFLP
jgi:hypothetical protein